ncbi:MAG: hypothetical protein AAFQ14_05200 [Cyanobacteria bacterium J06621_12]
MTISINFNAPVIRIPGFESKYDFAGVSNSLVRIFDGYLEARILQQFHFWLWLKRGGVIIFGFKWIYKALVKLMNEAIVGFSSYQIRKAITSLVKKEILVREQLHREHYGAINACIAYNRQYYYRINYSVLVQFIETKINSTNIPVEFPWHLQAEAELAQNTETKGFANTANQIYDTCQPDLRVSPNNTDITFKNHSSDTPPLTPPGGIIEGEQTQDSDFSQPSSHSEEQVQGNPSPPCQKNSNSQPIPFTQVIARPPGVEQKVNKKVRLKQHVVRQASVPSEVEVEPEVEVQNQTSAVVTNSAVDAQTERYTSDVSTPPPSSTNSALQKRPSQRRKTPKGTKPSFEGGLAPWKSLEQFRKFYRALIASPYVRRLAKNLEALVNRIVTELKQGVPHPFWDDFIAGREIGSSTRQEWQMSDGSPHPDFIEYLAEKLIKGNNTQTREIAIAEALRIAKDPETARFFWKECKVSLVNAKAQTERDRALGVSHPVTPTWTHERVEPTIEEAAAASMEIKGINQQTTMAISAASSSTPQLPGDGKPKSIPPDRQPAEASAITTADPWLDDQPQRKKSIREIYAELHGGMDKIPSILQPKKVRGRRTDSSSKLDLNNLDIAQINKALADPVLNADLTPQIMRSDYRIITDDFGRITGVEPPLDEE